MKATSIPVTATGPSGGPARQHSRAAPLWPTACPAEVKVKAGAQFFQTQAIYHPEQFGSFMKAVRPFKVKVLAGILVLRNAKMAEFMNANIPGEIGRAHV